jgi:AraC-like DNA-binding protein
MEDRLETMGKTVTRFAGGDIASELALALRIESSILCRSVVAPPWGFGVAARNEGSFHLVLDGQGWLYLEGAPHATQLGAGDLVILPRGQAHWVKDSPRSAAPMLSAILAEHRVVDGELRFGGVSGPLTEIVCGTFRMDGPRALDGIVPALVHARASAGAAWWPAVFIAVRDEVRAPTPGGSAVVNRLLESLLADALRTSLSMEDESELAITLADRRLGAALAAIRQRPEAEWSVVSLARVAAMSRSAFSDRFRRVVGVPPMRFVTRVRLTAGADLLRTTDATVADVARRTGYRSEEAFSRAFRDRFGASPSSFRQRSTARSGRQRRCRAETCSRH